MHLLADGTYSPTDWLVVAMVTLAISYILLRPRTKKKDPLDERPRLSVSQQRAVERQMETLLVDLTEMARQMSAQIDTRAARLEALIREADEKLAALKAASEGRDFSLPEEERHGGGDPGRRLPLERPPLERPPMRLAVPDEPDPRHAEIYRLADQGLAAQQIAQRLNRPKGEIELILALRSR